MARTIVKLRNYFIIKWLIAAIFSTAMLVIITHLPQDVMPDRLQVSGLDKIEHVIAYGVITLLFILSIKKRFSLFRAIILLFAISVFGAIDELTQPLVNRVASPIDWLADIIGIVAVLFSSLHISSSKRQASPNVDLETLKD